jgi:hypothetical protein
MTDAEIWQSYYDYAGALKAMAVPGPTGGVIGRSIRYLVDRLAAFWKRHQQTLIPVLSQLAIAAIEALVSQQGAFDTTNPPGPA